jgi:mannose PTS system EIID component
MKKLDKIQKIDLWRIFWRSFFIQGSWNFKALIGVGFAYCAIPIAQRLYKDEKAMAEFLDRHLIFFNAHPYFANICLGSCAHLEEAAIANPEIWKDLRPISVFKERLIGPLGALGDEIFWKALKPFAAAFAVFLGIISGWIAIPVFLIVFNVPHLIARVKGLSIGYSLGFDIISLLSRRKLEKYTRLATALGSFFTGLYIVAAAQWNIEENVLNVFIFSFGIIASFYLLSHKRSINFILLVTSVISVIFSFITYKLL